MSKIKEVYEYAAGRNLSTVCIFRHGVRKEITCRKAISKGFSTKTNSPLSRRRRDGTVSPIKGLSEQFGHKTDGQLVQKSASELLELNKFGRTSLHEIENNLTEMGLTLSMNLNFPPWDGSGNGAELIRILSQQEPGGGFQMEDNAVTALGIDLMKVNQRLQESAKTKDRKIISILHAKYLLELLESKFEKDIPCLKGLLKPHRNWLAKKSK